MWQTTEKVKEYMVSLLCTFLTLFPALRFNKNICFILIQRIKMLFCILKHFIHAVCVYTMWETTQASKEASHTGSADRGVI